MFGNVGHEDTVRSFVQKGVGLCDGIATLVGATYVLRFYGWMIVVVVVVVVVGHAMLCNFVYDWYWY